MIDILNSNAFEMTTLAAALKLVPYKPMRLGPGGLALFDEKPISTLSIAIEKKNGQLSLIDATPRGSAGDYLGDQKGTLYPFVANHLRRTGKIFADEVQGVRLFGTEDQTLTVEAKRNEQLATLQSMHEVTWEYHRMGALIGKVMDADGVKILLDVYAAFGLTQVTYDFALSDDNLDPRAGAEAVADLIDEALGASSYEHIHVLAGSAFYDALQAHPFIKDALRMTEGLLLLKDRRAGFDMGSLTFERAKRWRVRNSAGAMIDFIPTNEAYAFPVGATTENGPMFIGRFAPQPFLQTVNRLNPPLVIKAVVDPADQFIELIGISCPLYLNTRPDAVIRLTKS